MEGNVQERSKGCSAEQVEQATASESSQNSLLTEMDFYSLLSGTENGSLSTFLADGLVPEDPLATSVYPSAESSAEVSCTPLSIDHSLQNNAHSGHRKSPTSSTSFTPVETLKKLVDIQLRLENLVQSLSIKPAIPGNIADVYRITETLVDVLHGLSGGDSAFCRQQNPSGSNGAAVLLFSSCYYSLIVACGHFVRILQLDIQGSQNSTDCDSGSPIWYGGPQSDSPQSPLAISVGEFRLALPRKSLAEMNLHLVKQTLQHLRRSMQRQGQNRFSPIPRTRTPGTEDNEYSPQSPSATLNPLAGPLGTALHDLQQKEDDLFHALNITGLNEDWGHTNRSYTKHHSTNDLFTRSGEFYRGEDSFLQ